MSDDVDMEVMEEGGLANRRISRRRLIQAGAIVGGVAWSAPVIDSFISKAGATSLSNYCCSCFNPPYSASKTYQGEADNHPPSAAACASYCAGLGYSNFTWCGPSAQQLSYVSNSTSPGCYTGSATSLTAATDCCTGTVTNPSTCTTALGTYVG